MKREEIKQATFLGLIYRFGERFFAQFISMLVTIILARILDPNEYGIVSIVTVLITIANVFVTHGFGNSLIQKRNADNKDYCTIFWSGLVVSFILYAIIFIMAPFISEYYEQEIITHVIRIMSLKLPFAAINSVQSAYISKKLLFKKFFYVTLFSTLVSAVIGIIFAVCGLGVWALVAQYLSNAIVSTIVMMVSSEWRPKAYFSFSRFKQLFSFASKELATGIIMTTYDEIRSLIIGKKYGSVDLSFYTKGQQFPQIIGNNVSTTIGNVMFPVYSSIQDDLDKLKWAVRRSCRISYFILFPVMFGFFAVAESFVEILLSEKWLPCVQYLRVFCVVYLFKPLKNINKSALKALGRTDLNLYVELIEKVIGIFFVYLTMNISVKSLAYSTLITYFLAAIAEAVINGKILKYTFCEQFKDIIPPLLISITMVLVVYFIGLLPIDSKLIIMIIQIVFGLCFYLYLSKIIRLETYNYIMNTLKSFISKNKAN